MLPGTLLPRTVPTGSLALTNPEGFLLIEKKIPMKELADNYCGEINSDSITTTNTLLTEWHLSHFLPGFSLVSFKQ